MRVLVNMLSSSASTYQLRARPIAASRPLSEENIDGRHRQLPRVRCCRAECLLSAQIDPKVDTFWHPWNPFRWPSPLGLQRGLDVQLILRFHVCHY